MKHRQPGLFDVEERTAKLTKMGDPLVALKARIDWEAFRPELNRVHEKDRKSDAGAKPIDVVLMFKILILQHLLLNGHHQLVSFLVMQIHLMHLDIQHHDLSFIK